MLNTIRDSLGTPVLPPPGTRHADGSSRDGERDMPLSDMRSDQIRDALDDASRDGTVCVVGAGYVGLVTAAALAGSGREVRVVEVRQERLATIRAGKAPFYEPGLDGLLAEVIRNGTLTVTAELEPALGGAGIVAIAVGTPPRGIGQGADLSQVRTAVTAAAAVAAPGTLFVIKSSVPPGTTRLLQREVAIRRPDLLIVACPEFLREGCALEDVRRPSRLVVGGADAAASRRVAAVFAQPGGNTPVVLTDSTSAEMIKFGSNSFLALKISFINEMAHLCDLFGADIASVADGIGMDARIGRDYLNAGLGFGGSCLPKDLAALEDAAAKRGYSFSLLHSVVSINRQQRQRIAGRVLALLGGDAYDRRVAVLGLAFKAGTDDVRESPAVALCEDLVELGALVRATDPLARAAALESSGRVEIVADVNACVRDAEVIVVATDWPEYRDLDWQEIAALVSQRAVVDGRNCLDAKAVRQAGFDYSGVGRGRD